MRSVQAFAAICLAAMMVTTTGCEIVAGVDRDKIAGDTGGGTTSTQGRGALAGYNNGVVSGWAQVIGQDAPATVRIEVDGSVVQTVTADDLRQDLLDKGVHPTGIAGFSVDIGVQTDGAVVSAFVDEDDSELNGSPLTVSN
jgi:hypothetical protein